MQASNLGNYFEDFKEGEIIEHSLSKTIFECDNNFFSLLTMNHHPLHINTQYASENQHEKIIVVGTLIFSLVVGISVPDISGKAIANLGYENIDHLKPVYIGDTIYARTRIISKNESTTKKDRGIVYVETTGYNQNNQDVIKFKRKVLVKNNNSPK